MRAVWQPRWRKRGRVAAPAKRLVPSCVNRAAAAAGSPSTVAKYRRSPGVSCSMAIMRRRSPPSRDAAYRWATEVKAERLGWVAVGALFDSGMSWAQRRAARSILRAESVARADDLLTSGES
jgi:hypothetical protein